MSKSRVTFQVTVKLVKLQSDLLGKEVTYHAIFPPGYSETGEKCGVLYLLHGLFGSYENWTLNTRILEYAADHSFVIICPDAGDSWYTDNPNLPTHKYESCFFREVLPDAEARFNIGQNRDRRAITGISMGGYGAFKFAFRRPEMFCFAASMSGAFHAADIFESERHGEWSEIEPSIQYAFGNDNRLRSDNSLAAIVTNFPHQMIPELPFLYFECGAEDSFLEANKNLSKIFTERNIAHTFEQHPGGHDWDHWDDQLSHILNLTGVYLGTIVATSKRSE